MYRITYKYDAQYNRYKVFYRGFIIGYIYNVMHSCTHYYTVLSDIFTVQHYNKTKEQIRVSLKHLCNMYDTDIVEYHKHNKGREIYRTHL